MKARTIQMTIIADTREFRRQLIRAQLRLERSWWRRLGLRFALWRIAHESKP